MQSWTRRDPPRPSGAPSGCVKTAITDACCNTKYAGVASKTADLAVILISKRPSNKHSSTLDNLNQSPAE
jgi:hypothetical protein